MGRKATLERGGWQAAGGAPGNPGETEVSWVQWTESTGHRSIIHLLVAVWFSTITWTYTDSISVQKFTEWRFKLSEKDHKEKVLISLTSLTFRAFPHFPHVHIWWQIYWPLLSLLRCKATLCILRSRIFEAVWQISGQMWSTGGQGGRAGQTTD